MFIECEKMTPPWRRCKCEHEDDEAIRDAAASSGDAESDWHATTNHTTTQYTIGRYNKNHTNTNYKSQLGSSRSSFGTHITTGSSRSDLRTHTTTATTTPPDASHQASQSPDSRLSSRPRDQHPQGSRVNCMSSAGLSVELIHNLLHPQACGVESREVMPPTKEPRCRKLSLRICRVRRVSREAHRTWRT